MVNGSHHINNDGYLLYVYTSNYSSRQKLPIPFASNAKITTPTFVKCNEHISWLTWCSNSMEIFLPIHIT